MIRRLHSRSARRFIASMLTAVLGAGMTVDSAGLDRCEHHGAASLMGAAGTAGDGYVARATGAADAAADVAAASAAVDAHGASRVGDHHAADAAPASAAKPGDHESHGSCTCLGVCATAQIIALPVAGIPGLHIVHAARPAPRRNAVAAPASSHLELLPYAIAPPTLSLG